MSWKQFYGAGQFLKLKAVPSGIIYSMYIKFVLGTIKKFSDRFDYGFCRSFI